MAISTNCPNCAALFRLGDEMAGKKVKCQKCAHIFVIPMAGEPSLPPVKRAPEMELDDAPAPSAKSAAGITATPKSKAPPSAPLDDDDDPDEPRSKKTSKPPPLSTSASRPPLKSRRRDEAKSGSGMMIVLFLFLGLGLVSCLICGGVAGWWVVSESKDNKPKPPVPIAVKDMKKDMMDGVKDFDKKMDGDMTRKEFPPIDGFKEKKNPPAGGIDVVLGANGVYVSANRLTEQDALFKDQFQQKKRHKLFLVQMQAGQQYQIDLMSQEFDAFLYVLQNNVILAFDDDGGEGLNSRIVFRPPNTGLYHIVATSLGGNSNGNFTLTVQRLGGK
jgi:predicted Zn finger-like uncharacterized protein